jgi:microcystin-dependent protein
MSTPFIGEIRMFAGNFAPAGWMFCEGQILSVSEFESLCQLIGTTYGGDGGFDGNGNPFGTFALPDMRGRLPLHVSNDYALGEKGGVEEVTLTMNQIPSHGHPILATQSLATSREPAGKLLAPAASSTITPYGEDAPFLPLHPSAVGSVGGSQPHTNRQPALCVSFIISLYGIYPSPT